MLKTITILLFFYSQLGNADQDSSFLDPKYENLHHPITTSSEFSPTHEILSRNNDITDLIQVQSSVKSQQSRGTCAIFAALGLLESMLIIKQNFPTAIDLSEEWLEYLIMREKTSEGSNVWLNYNALLKYGAPYEPTFPYIGETWETTSHSELAMKRCGSLSSYKLTSCLLAHRNPDLLPLSSTTLKDTNSPYYDLEFLTARNEAYQFRDDHIKYESNNYWVHTSKEVKELLLKKIPLNLSIDFYYGSWNHRMAADFGIPRDMNLWNSGIVTFPESGSIDLVRSTEKPAGHAIIIVGFDDDVILNYEHKMLNGTFKKFQRKGVYYFKNSWGISGFGVKFSYNDINYPGYGMISQDYAHKYGEFNILPIKP